MSTVSFSVHFGDRLTRTQKILLLLQDYPEIRDSYDMIVSKYYLIYPSDWCKRATIEREARQIQYDIGIFPVSQETKRARRKKQKEIIEQKKKKNIFERLWDFMRA